MKARSKSLIVASALVVLATAPTAFGAVLQGSFEGIATGSRIYSSDPTKTNFDGEIVTGTFSIDPTAQPLYSEDRNGSAYSTIASSTVGLTVHAHGLISTYGNDSAHPQYGSVTLTNAVGQQEALILVDAGSPYHSALVQLAGPLFNGTDFSTLRAGNVDLGRSYINFFDSRSFGAGVTLTSLTFASAVPEPATAWLMLAGFGALAPLLRIRRQCSRLSSSRS